MDERNRKQLIYVVLVAAIIFGGWNFRSRGSKAGESVESVEVSAVAALEATTTVSDSVLGNRYEWKRDPFEYGTTRGDADVEEQRGDELELSAISEGNGSLMAIINGALLGKGDEIDGWTVISIGKSSAVLSQNGREITLEIGQ